ncbi:MAG: patatin-like phospholipase family protein [Elusimicrobia bacterium]|nr:patatin-like phospholipase family protein [Elusimicrobiota bacterium]
MPAEASPVAFNRPAGLALAGGGALGAWQGGVVARLAEAGHSFQKVVGFSAGSLTGAAYFLNRAHELREYWGRIDDINVLRFAPRLKPLSLFSDAPIWEVMSHALDDDEARRAAICEFIVMSLRARDCTTAYGRFTPVGGDAWDGPFIPRITASCAIPWIFPPTVIEDEAGKGYHLDGGVPGKEWMRLDHLADCKEVLCVEMVRPEEVGARRWHPMGYWDQGAREVCKEHINRAIDSLRPLKSPPRVFRLYPSRRLDFTMLDFKAKYCVPAFDQGVQDANAFLRAPESYAVSMEPDARLSQESVPSLIRPVPGVASAEFS